MQCSKQFLSRDGVSRKKDDLFEKPVGTHTDRLYKISNWSSRSEVSDEFRDSHSVRSHPHDEAFI